MSHNDLWNDYEEITPAIQGIHSPSSQKVIRWHREQNLDLAFFVVELFWNWISNIFTFAFTQTEIIVYKGI